MLIQLILNDFWNRFILIEFSYKIFAVIFNASLLNVSFNTFLLKSQFVLIEPVFFLQIYNETAEKTWHYVNNSRYSLNRAKGTKSVLYSPGLLEY